MSLAADKKLRRGGNTMDREERRQFIAYYKQTIATYQRDLDDIEQLVSDFESPQSASLKANDERFQLIKTLDDALNEKEYFIEQITFFKQLVEGHKKVIPIGPRWK